MWCFAVACCRSIMIPLELHLSSSRQRSYVNRQMRRLILLAFMIFPKLHYTPSVTPVCHPYLHVNKVVTLFFLTPPRARIVGLKRVHGVGCQGPKAAAGFCILYCYAGKAFPGQGILWLISFRRSRSNARNTRRYGDWWDRELALNLLCTNRKTRCIYAMRRSYTKVA
jgi:hypothetical protein